LVVRVSQSETRRAALEELCSIYWPPVYAFVRSKGISAAEAEDLTQGFFAEFLARDDFSKLDQEQGKWRSYLLQSVSNFMKKDWRNRTRQKRAGNENAISLEGADIEGEVGLLEAADQTSPEILFERQWAATVLEQVVRRLEEDYAEKNQTSLFEALRFVISPSDPRKTYAEVAEEESMTETAIKAAAYRLRERYSRLLRETIAETLLDKESVDDEIRILMQAFK
jgi:RNA polymerase sigma-70 factor (ECF subfamily)